MSKEEVDRYIYEVGSGVIDASVFQAGYFQKHHMRTSVAAHTLNVAQSSVYLGRFLEHLGVRVNMHDLVLNSIACHMWPIGPTGHPSHIEGFIVTLADKYSSVKDLVKPNGWDRWRKPVTGSSTTRQNAGATA